MAYAGAGQGGGRRIRRGTQHGPAQQARQLREAWEQRARSTARDFFVASHPGWDVAEHWERQADSDAAFVLQGLDAAELAQADVLEIGCGVGRLAVPLAPRVLSYTGIDIAAAMVAEARRRHADLGNARFLACDGLGAPPAARDRLYQLAIAWAVFIHCPRDVLAALVADTWELLAPGGELRFQLLADPADAGAAPDGAEGHATPSGAQGAGRVPTGAAAVQEQVAEGRLVVPPESLALVEEADYMGAIFREAEVVPFLRALTGGEVTALREDALHIYGTVRKRCVAARADGAR